MSDLEQDPDPFKNETDPQHWIKSDKMAKYNIFIKTFLWRHQLNIDIE